LKTDNWFYGLFQSAPDLIALLLPMPGAFRPRNGEAGTADQPVKLPGRSELPPRLAMPKAGPWQQTCRDASQTLNN